MSNKIHEFDFNIYPRLLWITYDCDTDALNDMFPSTDGTKIPDLEDCESAVVYCVRRVKPDVRGGILIRFRHKSDMTCEEIAHESGHAALEVFRYVEAKVDFDNQEPFTYLIGFIADCCNQVKAGKFK